MSERHDNNSKVNQTGKCDPEILFFHRCKGDVDDNNLDNDDDKIMSL